MHSVVEKAGFRTVEVREQDGIYVNDVRVKLKGVNRHTFHPDYGRTSSKTFSIADVNRIKDMNMNAVRMSHYPPDRVFLDVCDSLGLFVLDELAGWQWPSYDSIVGRKLLKEMIYRDMNHPSIILWDNGNEGGWNTAYDADFKELDIQKREVLHPWSVFEKFNTAHYFNYDYLSMDNFAQRKIFLPTEFLHGLYDGGHGAGLEDYWQKMYDDPLCAGGFLWSYADECVMRTDTKTLDCDGNHAPDGILGPCFEKEGSFYAIRETWAPLHFEKRYITPDFNGLFNIENRFYFTDLAACSIVYKWVQLPIEGQEEEILYEQTISGLNLAPQHKGKLAVELIDGWQKADLLSIEAYDPHNRLIHIWTWPVQSPANYGDSKTKSEIIPTLEESANNYIFKTESFYIEIDKKNGQLQKAGNENGDVPIHGGPYLPGIDAVCESVEILKKDNAYQVIANYEKNALNIQWTIYGNGLVDLDVQYRLPVDRAAYAGISFDYSEDEIAGVRYMGDGPYRVWKNRMTGTQFGVWDKTYNNTITGYSGYEYPEFKGFYSNLYHVAFQNKSTPGFSVSCKTEDIFLRLFTPENPPDPAWTKVDYPPGDISFMHGILPIGTKFKPTTALGPQSSDLYYLQRRLENGRLSMALTFDFGIK